MIRAYAIFQHPNGSDWLVEVEGYREDHSVEMEISDISEMGMWCLRELGYSRVLARSPELWGQVAFRNKEDAFLFYLTFKK